MGDELRGMGIRRLGRYDTIPGGLTYNGRGIWDVGCCIFDSLFLQERVMIHKKPSVSVH